MKKMLLVMVLLALLVTGIRLAGNLAAGFGNSGNGGEVSAPEKLEDSEVRQRLQQLAEQYEDYREIYEHMDEYPIKLLAALCNNEEMTSAGVTRPTVTAISAWRAVRPPASQWSFFN